VLNKIFSKGYAGLRNWLLQRATAVVMALYSLLMVALLATQRPGNYQAWREMFSPAWVRLATLLFCLSLFVHAWLGVRDVLRDYVPSLRARMVLQVLVDTALLVYSAWSVTILWGV
jgi:succinate dehydrogenase / fumarate reductase membrane anchor subunit